jgi:hypothetical protein
MALALAKALAKAMVIIRRPTERNPVTLQRNPVYTVVCLPFFYTHRDPLRLSRECVVRVPRRVGSVIASERA